MFLLKIIISNRLCDNYLIIDNYQTENEKTKDKQKEIQFVLCM